MSRDEEAAAILVAIAKGKLTICPPAYAAPVKGGANLNTGLADRSEKLYRDSTSWMPQNRDTD
jgi:hypothetical protein